MKNALESFPTILSIHSIHGDTLELLPTISSIRPTGMWEVQKMHRYMDVTY